MTRPVHAHMFSSANGVSEAPDQWQFGAFGPEEGELMAAAIAGVTDVVLGHRLYDEWSQFWPTAGDGDPFGSFINPVRKHVVGRGLSGELPWNAVAIEGDPVAHVQALKEGDGGGITVAGGVETVRRLFLAGVVDTLTLTVHPVVTGPGRRLFDESTPVTRLQLVDSTVTGAGNAVLTYSLLP